ncbi:MAG: hypothetical protein NTW19_04590 [Planctomycetota bacterium]|nr:hypothetical protein [Planctomycetota bacterium]
MGIFRKLFGFLAASPTIADPVFGELTYSSRSGCWFREPPVDGAGFGLDVEALEAGPTQAQRDFYIEFRPQFDRYVAIAREYVRSRFPEPIDSENLSVFHLSIGREEDLRRGRFALELFHGEEDLVHTVTFEGGKVVEYDAG